MTIVNADYHAAKKESSIKWAKDLLECDFVIIDFETTGLNGEPVQVGICDSGGNKLMSTLIRPNTYDIEQGAERVHGISNEMVIRSPIFADIHGELFRILDGKPVVAYNERFDKRILCETCQMYNLPMPKSSPENWFDPMITYAAFRGDWNNYHKSYRWPKLTYALKDFDFVVEGDAHDALTDVLITYNLIHAMAK